ncbi:MAG: aminotransferase class I/II-fold pyridoxal phosphate-dependent enzyme [Oscillospiraceae bacterium]|nr:aminotransferase class I/II-fold pyridoxal phosphate-dependent enzyme [Oscillospiraceae bacterium]
MKYSEMDKQALEAEKQKCLERLSKYSKEDISLDLSRGKPSKEQLELSMKMLDVLDHHSLLDSESGQDCRNYGGLDGIPEAKRLLAHMMGTHSVNTIIGGNSSLTMMYQLISHGMTDGICGSTPWQEVKGRKFLCPVPGYDRHFAITEHFGFELVPVPMNSDGPDMDIVEKLVSSDDKIKGIWCVPKYENPTGIVYSADVVRRFAALKPAAEDFRIFWDNAYCVHNFDGKCAEIPDIISECDKAGNSDLVYEFCSTSKITFPGSGISAVASSPANLIDIRAFLKFATIGPDKINQLRHARFFRNSAGLRAHMKKHAAIMKPKFDAMYKVLNEELDRLGIAEWTVAKGGYFASYAMCRAFESHQAYQIIIPAKWLFELLDGDFCYLESRRVTNAFCRVFAYFFASMGVNMGVKFGVKTIFIVMSRGNAAAKNQSSVLCKTTKSPEPQPRG